MYIQNTTGTDAYFTSITGIITYSPTIIYANQSPFPSFSITGYVATGYSLGGTSQSIHSYISNNGVYMYVSAFGDFASTTQTDGYIRNSDLNWTAMSGSYNGSNYTINRYCYMSRSDNILLQQLDQQQQKVEFIYQMIMEQH